MVNTVNLREAKIVKTSPSSFGITIPKAFIDNGQLEHGDVVDVVITVVGRQEASE